MDNAPNKIEKKKLTFYKRILNLNSRVKKRIRLNLKKKQAYSFFFNIVKKHLFLVEYTKFFAYIKISPNNTLTTLTTKTGKVLYSLSAGKLNLRSSKRTYKYVYKIILEKFFKYLLQKEILTNIYFKITAPKLLRKRLLKNILLPRIKGKNCAVEMQRLLPFNGCRPPKKRRKKRQGLRVFKK